VLFTDIVRCTERAGEIGDAAWRTLLDEHDAVAARAVQSVGGSLVCRQSGWLGTSTGTRRLKRSVGDPRDRQLV
jgi:hypothetical protein